MLRCCDDSAHFRCRVESTFASGRWLRLRCCDVATSMSMSGWLNTFFQCRCQMTQHFINFLTSIIRSKFKIHILTIWLIPQCSQGQDKKNDITSGQIGPRVPSGLNLQDSLKIWWTLHVNKFKLTLLFQICYSKVSKNTIKEQNCRAFVVTSTQNHWIYILFNIIEIFKQIIKI